MSNSRRGKRRLESFSETESMDEGDFENNGKEIKKSKQSSIVVN
jgi:hypothetical protein